MNGSIQWLGFAGMGLVVLAYVPQIVHLVRARCTAGVSTWAYLMWAVSATLLLVYAITIGDPVYISLQAYQLVVLTLIYLLSRRHKGQPCDAHCGTPESHEPEIIVTSPQPMGNLDAPVPVRLESVAATHVLPLQNPAGPLDLRSPTGTVQEGPTRTAGP